MTRFVRPARVDDAPAIASTSLAAWRVAFHEHVPLTAIEAMDADTAAQEWRTAIADPPTPGHRVLVATDAEVVRGWAAVAPAADADLAGVLGVMEIVDLVVAPNAWGHGHGSRLLHACVDHARAGGATTAVTWVALVDEPRRAFLQSQGFGPDGAIRDLDLDGSGQTILRQVRLATSLEQG